MSWPQCTGACSAAPIREAGILVDLGQVQRSRGRTDEARRTWQLALRMFEEFDGDPRTAYVRTQLKELSLQGG